MSAKSKNRKQNRIHPKVRAWYEDSLNNCLTELETRAEPDPESDNKERKSNVY